MGLLGHLRADVQRFVGRYKRVWEGVYGDASEVPQAGPGFGGGKRERLFRARHQEVRELAGRDDAVPHDTEALVAWESLAALVATTPGTGPVHVVDFGGSIGEAYLWVSARVGRPVRWTVVEIPDICRVGASIHAEDGNIAFVPFTELEGITAPVDVVFSRSAIQYAPDWRATLRSLCGLGAAAMLFSLVPVGDVPTFATGQVNHKGSVIPYWFINAGEFSQTLEETGYDVVAQGPHSRLPNMRNFPPGYRLPTTRQYIARRSRGPPARRAATAPGRGRRSG